MNAQHLIGRMICVGNSRIIELPINLTGFYFKRAIYFPIAPGRYASRLNCNDLEEYEIEDFNLALPTATLLTCQLVWKETALALSVSHLEIMLAPVAITPFHPDTLS